MDGFEQNTTIEEIITHPKYNRIANHDYDVALVKLKNPIKYNNHVRPVCLAKSDFDTGTNCYVTGWGYTSEDGNIAQVCDKQTSPSSVITCRCYDELLVNISQ